jgi:hypothetical protein
METDYNCAEEGLILSTGHHKVCKGLKHTEGLSTVLWL